MNTKNLFLTKNGMYYDYNYTTNIYSSFIIIHEDHIGYIIGRNGKNIKKIEYMTNSKITLKPNTYYSDENNWFFIESNDLHNLISACNKITSIACNAEYKIYRNFTYYIHLKKYKYYNNMYTKYAYINPQIPIPRPSPNYSPNYSPSYSPNYSPNFIVTDELLEI